MQAVPVILTCVVSFPAALIKIVIFKINMAAKNKKYWYNISVEKNFEIALGCYLLNLRADIPHYLFMNSSENFTLSYPKL